MSKRILWIEDDYFAIGGLMRPLKKAGYEIDAATSAEEAYRKILDSPVSYDLIVVDLILPASDKESNDQDAQLPLVVHSWKDEKYYGIGLIRWLIEVEKIECPVLMLSVVRDPIKAYGLEHLGIAGYLSKTGLLPSWVTDQVLKLLPSTKGITE
jgi:CheY-like chemotaxis protein